MNKSGFEGFGSEVRGSSGNPRKRPRQNNIVESKGRTVQVLTDIPQEFGAGGQGSVAKQNKRIASSSKITIDSSHSSRLFKPMFAPKPLIDPFSLDSGSKPATLTTPMRPPNFMQTLPSATQTTKGSVNHNISTPFGGLMSGPFAVAHALDGSKSENKTLLAPHLRIKDSLVHPDSSNKPLSSRLKLDKNLVFPPSLSLSPLRPLQSFSLNPAESSGVPPIGEKLTYISETPLSNMDLAAILKAEQNPTDLQLNGDQLEFSRGLLASPDKKSGKGRKFIRNGIAEKVQHLMARSQTSYTLWQKEIHSAHSSRLPKADIRLFVIEVLHTAYSPSSLRNPSSMRSVLTRCHVLSHTTRHTTEEDSSSVEKRLAPLAEGYVLFSLTAGGVGPNHFTVPNPSKGSYVHVWKPFYEVQLPTSSGFGVNNAESNDGSSVGTETPDTLEKLPSALLCSRFLILSSQKPRT